MAELGTVPPNVAHVATLEAAAVLGLALVLLHVLVLVVLLLLDSADPVEERDQWWTRASSCVSLNAGVSSALPAPLWTVLHVMSNLAADPAAAIVGGQLAIGQHLGVKEVVLRHKTPKERCSHFGISAPVKELRKWSWTHDFRAGDGVERRSKQFPPVYERLHDEVCHWKNRGVISTDVQVP